MQTKRPCRVWGKTNTKLLKSERDTNKVGCILIMCSSRYFAGRFFSSSIWLLEQFRKVDNRQVCDEADSLIYFVAFSVYLLISLSLSLFLRLSLFCLFFFLLQKYQLQVSSYEASFLVSCISEVWVVILNIKYECAFVCVVDALSVVCMLDKSQWREEKKTA